MSVEDTTRGPAGLAAVVAGRAPDAELAGLLDAVDPGELAGDDLAAYVVARFRLHNRAEALLLAGMRELGTAVDGQTGRLAGSDEFSGDEVAMLLGHSRTMTSRRLDLADDLHGRLPVLGAALWSGWLDEPKVRAISETVADLCDDHARQAVAVVLPEAGGLPVMALRERVGEVALDLDPEWAERRRRRAEARGRVILSSNPSGTATLAFVDAPSPDGIDSQARIDALAAALRHLGVRTPANVLRLQVGMRLLNGSCEAMTDRDITLLLAAEYHAADHPTTRTTPTPASTGPTTPTDPAGPTAPTTVLTAPTPTAPTDPTADLTAAAPATGLTAPTPTGPTVGRIGVPTAGLAVGRATGRVASRATARLTISVLTGRRTMMTPRTTTRWTAPWRTTPRRTAPRATAT